MKLDRKLQLNILTFYKVLSILLFVLTIYHINLYAVAEKITNLGILFQDGYILWISLSILIVPLIFSFLKFKNFDEKKFDLLLNLFKVYYLCFILFIFITSSLNKDTTYLIEILITITITLIWGFYRKGNSINDFLIGESIQLDIIKILLPVLLSLPFFLSNFKFFNIEIATVQVLFLLLVFGITLLMDFLYFKLGKEKTKLIMIGLVILALIYSFMVRTLSSSHIDFDTRDYYTELINTAPFLLITLIYLLVSFIHMDYQHTKFNKSLTYSLVIMIISFSIISLYFLVAFDYYRQYPHIMLLKTLSLLLGLVISILFIVTIYGLTYKRKAVIFLSCLSILCLFSGLISLLFLIEISIITLPISFILVIVNLFILLFDKKQIPVDLNKVESLSE